MPFLTPTADSDGCGPGSIPDKKHGNLDPFQKSNLEGTDDVEGDLDLEWGGGDGLRDEEAWIDDEDEDEVLYC